MGKSVPTDESVGYSRAPLVGLYSFLLRRTPGLTPGATYSLARRGRAGWKQWPVVSCQIQTRGPSLGFPALEQTRGSPPSLRMTAYFTNLVPKTSVVSSRLSVKAPNLGSFASLRISARGSDAAQAPQLRVAPRPRQRRARFQGVHGAPLRLRSGLGPSTLG